ncbi:MAG: type I methionyl aminopeptidase [Bacteroidetes bacterium GWE2_41_25]|nr:MAG: type I methionyl aminopeptidase [Bacteroidetes bacterium GWA2_40_15]OFX97196.1 MAG: type I methionyl aminopeptidase [Bacteroidetes bacterium GWC2_40_22]OFY05090.1 MAG: type I methionyl aminopeptidase [Bacteroidetes bacterium GWE2_41_25]OFY57244.1 MAG: type I methionyl aminopeptidase [Bacteroidetes bacterium GWF2_41_9]HAM09652.1 type I methionyl aminopeptidase [Bacteroidales bacterium]
MLYCKTDEEVGFLRESNQLVSRTLGEIAALISPGITTLYLDKIAEEYIRDNGAVPGFKGYGGFPGTLCTSVNDEVVHGIPSEYILKEGDIISVDCGVILNGWYGDSAYTFAVGEIKEEVQRLLDYTKASLEEGVREAVAGNRVGDISFAVQSKAESGGYSVVRELVGHGLGKKLHEPPEVANWGKKGTGPKMDKGLVICIEPMINAGKKETWQMSDGWTIRTADGKPSAHFEYAVAVDRGKADILTTFEYIEKVLNKK